MTAPTSPHAMKYHSAFDIIGPVMVGPSSSHTAGALRIARICRQLFDHEPCAVEFQLMGSFAQTYRGHGTDRALVAGMLNFATDDERLPQALEVARERGLEVSFSVGSGALYHPNTVRIRNRSPGKEMEVVGSSLGGGKVEIVEIDTFPVRLSGDRPALVLWHIDRPGFLAAVLGAIAGQGMNVARLSLERARRGGTALVAIEIDRRVAQDTWLEALEPIRPALIKSFWVDPV